MLFFKISDAVINLKFKQSGQNHRIICLKDANGMAVNEDPDQTATIGTVCSGSGPICPRAEDYYGTSKLLFHFA